MIKAASIILTTIMHFENSRRSSAYTVLPLATCGIVNERLTVRGIADVNVRKAGQRGGTAAAPAAGALIPQAQIALIH